MAATPGGDPFLQQLTFEPGIFDLSTSLFPISIRDQMIRAWMAVDRAAAEGLIGRERPLAVVGAGAGGVTAAMHAYELGVQVTLFERERDPFSRQASCRTRWIEPAQYDWPALHWKETSFPFSSFPTPTPPLRLKWTADYGDQLAKSWTATLTAFQQQFPAFQPVYGVDWEDYALFPPEQLWPDQVLLKLRSLPTSIPFSLVISCVGAGRERVFLHNVPLQNGRWDPNALPPGQRFTSIRFWDNDTLQEEGLGRPRTTRPRVLIAGGGDGALQDFIRAVTGQKAARDLLDAVPLPDELVLLLALAEDSFQRAHLWTFENRNEHELLLSLHQAYEKVLDQLLADPTRREQIWTGLRELVRPQEEFRPIVTLAYGCHHFGRCYGLNRFIALLLCRFLRETEKRDPFCPQTRLDQVIGADSAHSCDPNNARGCYDVPHRALPRAGCCDGVTPASLDRSPWFDPAQPYDIVLLRFGLDAEDKAIVGSDPPRRRQLLPFHVAQR